MRNYRLLKIIASFVFAIIFLFSTGQFSLADSDNAVVINIHGEINDALVAYLDREVTAAQENGAEVIILDIDTWGGFIHSSERINDILSNVQVPTIAYISKKAVSAGVMVTISCDKVAMTPGSNSGAAETIPNDEKTLSAWVGMLTSAAEVAGRPIDVVKSMADKRMVIDGLIEEGALLNITANQAVEYGYADVVASSHQEALTAFGYEGYDISTADVTTADKVARILTGSIALNILFSAGIFFMIMEIFTAGFGAFGILAILCFALYFFGGVIAGYTQWWAVALFIIGAVALGIELIVPGFGIFGAIGIVFTLLGLLFSAKNMREIVIRGGIALVVCVVSIPIMIKIFGRLKIFDKIILKSSSSAEEGYIVPTPQRLSINGMTGIAATDLRPSGMAQIDGRRIDVLSIEGFVNKGTKIKVIETKGNRIVVESQK
ncbi:MAG: nodulation protein NfeD [Clostridiales bacterium]|nr:nodulation protein NfeD [Clostridiales bacterium]